MLQFLLGIERVRTYHNKPSSERSVKGDGELQHIGQLNSDAITGHKICFALQISRKIRAQAIDVGITQRFTKTAEPRHVAVSLETPINEFGQRSEAVKA